MGLRSIGAMLILGGVVIATLGASAPVPRLRSAGNESTQVPSVDIELALAVDVSYSMEPEEQKLQREGYAEAITSPEFLQMVKTGPQGRSL